MAITISGATLRGGFTVAGSPAADRPSFTLTSYTDFNTYQIGYGLEADLTSMNIGGTYGASQAFYQVNLGVPYGGSSTKSAELFAFWNNAGLTLGNTYMFDVEWGPGSSTNTTRNAAVLDFYYYGEDSTWLNIGAVDTNITGWDTPGQDPFNAIKVANGTFYFPAKFTLITPTIQDSTNWC
jgi:hypothetical protein